MLLADGGIDINQDWKLRQFSTLGDIVNKLLPVALILGGIVFFIMAVVAGFNILAGAGSDDPKAMNKWRETLFSAMVGLILMFAAFWILQIINFITKGALNSLL